MKSKVMVTLLVFHLGFFLFGLITIVNSSEKANKLVKESMNIEEQTENKELYNESIKLYTKEYRRNGSLILIASSVGIIGFGIDMNSRKKKDCYSSKN